MHIYGAVQCNNIELSGLSEPRDFFMSILEQCDWINFHLNLSSTCTCIIK